MHRSVFQRAFETKLEKGKAQEGKEMEIVVRVERTLVVSAKDERIDSSAQLLITLSAFRLRPVRMKVT